MVSGESEADLQSPLASSSSRQRLQVQKGTVFEGVLEVPQRASLTLAPTRQFLPTVWVCNCRHGASGSFRQRGKKPTDPAYGLNLQKLPRGHDAPFLLSVTCRFLARIWEDLETHFPCQAASFPPRFFDGFLPHHSVS